MFSEYYYLFQKNFSIFSKGKKFSPYETYSVLIFFGGYMKKFTVISLSLILAGMMLFMFACAKKEEHDDGSGATNSSTPDTTTPTVTWTKQLGTNTNDYAYGIATDSSDNVYVTGTTWGGLDGNSNTGRWDLFVVKYNSSGTKQWTKQLGTTSDETAYGIATDSSGNVYVTGYTAGGLDGNTSEGDWDLFFIKYNSSGAKQWSRQLGTSQSDIARGVTTDLSGNIYVTGDTSDELDGNNKVGGKDLFVVKYNSEGIKQWTKQLGTNAYDEAYGIATDSSGNVYVTGYTAGGLDGNSSYGSKDLFVVKYNSSGTKQWTKQLGTSSDDEAYGIAADSSGNVYVAGSTSGGLDGNTSAGNSDLFVVKYDSDGNKL